MSSTTRVLRRATTSTIQDKFLVGYQGWFTCPGDGEPIAPGHHGWFHWFDQPLQSGGKPRTDLWPDVSEYSPSELFTASGLVLENGEQAFLFSSRNPKTVRRHFHLMALHGVDGAFLQRFAGQVDTEGDNVGIKRLRDEVGDRVREAAELEGRVFAIMYDVSGVAPDRIQAILERDWIHLIRNKGVLDSPSYLKEKGKPVIAFWGFGFEGSHHSPSTVASIATFFRQNTPGGAYLIAGTPAYWRTSSNDADRNPEFVDLWLNEFDAISPWTVGRFGDEREADRFADDVLKEDATFLQRRNEQGVGRKVDYMPVVFPGFSGFNLKEGGWAFNGIKRNGGKFFWKQISNAHRHGARIMYGAMWDEYDEGTALMPVVENKRCIPKSEKWPFMALDEDGYDLPKDWYMRICGFAGDGLRSERRIHESFPVKELQDYWSIRPRYEDSHEISASNNTASSSGAGISDGLSYQEWLASQNEDKDEPPPPPYSLEAAETSDTITEPTPAALPTGTSTSLATTSTSPLPVDTTSRPHQSVTSSTPSSTSVRPLPGSTQIDMSTSSLTDSFDRHSLTSSSSGSPSSQSARITQRPPHQANTSAPDFPVVTPPSTPTATTRTDTPQESQGQWSQAQWPPLEWRQEPSQHFTFLRPPRHPQTQAGRLQSSPRPGTFRPESSHVTPPVASSAPLRPPSGPPPSTGRPVSQPTPSQGYPGPYPPLQIMRPTSPYAMTAGPSPGAEPVSPHGLPIPSAYGQSQDMMQTGVAQFPVPSGPVESHNRLGYYRPPQHSPYQRPIYPGQPGQQPPYNPGQQMPTGPGPSFPSPMAAYSAPHPTTAGPYRDGPPPNAGSYAVYPAPAPYLRTPSPAPSNGPLGFAITAADTLGLGDNTRKQIERVAQRGNKLLNKFM